MGNHTATRSRGRSGKAASGTSTGRAAPAAAPSRWQGGGGEPATTFLDHTPTADSARPTVYDSPTQRAAIHLQALGTVGLHREDASGFDAQGRRILNKAGERAEVGFTDIEAEALRGQSLLHNHPSGTSFSVQDARFGARYEVTMHVVGADPEARLEGVRQQSLPPSAYLFTMRYGPVPHTLPRGSAERDIFLRDRSQRIERELARLNGPTMQRFLDRVYAGAMTVDQADAAHMHQVWNQVAHALPDDLVYTWEILTP